VSALAIGSADHVARSVYGHVRPRLEQQIGKALGHPLQLGDYRGFGWAGLRLGPTRVLPGTADGSSLRASQLSVSLDPISSLRRRLPVLQLTLAGLEVDLRRNAQGQYWVFGAGDPDAPPPRLDLRLRMQQPARVAIRPAPEASRLLRLAVQASAELQVHDEAIQVRGSLQPLDGRGVAGDGRVRLVAQGNWGQQRLQAELLSRRFPLQLPARLLGLPGALQGSGDGRVRVGWRDGRPDCQGELRLRQVQWQAPGSNPPFGVKDPLLRCRGERLSLAPTDWRWGDLSGRVGLQARWNRQQLVVDTLEIRRRGSWLKAQGELGRQLKLRGDWRLQPADLPLPPDTPLDLIGSAVTGRLRVEGPWPTPLVETDLRQPVNPVLGSWSGRLRWQDQLLRLERFRSDHLTASGSLPLRLQPGQQLRLGSLDLQLTLRDYPLPKLGALVGTSLEGVLQASGTIRGPLSGLTPDFDLRVSSPGAGPLRVSETWVGNWFGDPAGGGRLAMEATGTAETAALEASLDRRWVPRTVLLRRGAGELALRGTPRLYRWNADSFPLEGLLLTLGPRSQRQPLQGNLSGQGELELQPLAFRGSARLERPVLLGVWARTTTIEGSYTERSYQARLDVVPLSSGEVAIDWRGRWKGPFRATITGRNLRDPLVRQLLEAWPRWQGEEPITQGSAMDLGTLLIDTLGGSLDDQLAALDRARAALRGARQDPLSGLSTAERLEKLAARFNVDATLEGPRLVDTRADLRVDGHLWLPGQDMDLALTGEPVRLQLRGPFRLGSGQLSFSGLPLALLALLTPVPAGLRGNLGASGTYRLGGSEPELAIAMTLDDAAVGETSLALERGAVAVAEDMLTLDLAVRAEGASSNIELAGTVPLNPATEGMELRLASRDDGLRFLTGLAGPGGEWKQGAGDLQLLVRGSLNQPIANGFLRFRDTTMVLAGQTVEDLQATVLFDFEELFLQELTARVGQGGSVSGSGSLGLLEPAFNEAREPSRLQIVLKDVPFDLPRVKAEAAGTLLVAGSLAELALSGDLAVARGAINVQPAEVGSTGEDSVSKLALEGWQFEKPLVLSGPGVESQASASLRDLVPRFSVVGFDNLRLTLGPDLTVGVPNLASFASEGLLTINGRLDPTLEARGVVRLKRGRLSLFTTTFSLDPDAPNVAVFTPSAGLIPYVDIALQTRVSDSLRVGAAGASGSYAPSVAEVEAQGGATGLDQLNLVRVYLSVSGPADRLADTLSLRSSPPLPEDRLLALIGGNSLAGLTGAGAGAALATVVGQSLLSPLLGTLSDAFNQRLSFALYPAYVNQSVGSGSERRSERVPPQLVLGAEIGLDITERFNASVLAAPNRSDVPPQLNLNFKASELINLQGSVDTEGVWQTQLQVFFRF
jgi:translocation and assembly module TamB